MTDSEMASQDVDYAPWPKIRMELSILFAELIDDPRYIGQVMNIVELLGDHQFPQKEQI
jgi:hypothetical protein